MHTTATLHVHPTCASNRRLIEQLQTTTGCLVILHNHKPRMIQPSSRPVTFDPNNGGNAA